MQRVDGSAINVITHDVQIDVHVHRRICAGRQLDLDKCGMAEELKLGRLAK